MKTVVHPGRAAAIWHLLKRQPQCGPKTRLVDPAHTARYAPVNQDRGDRLDAQTVRRGGDRRSGHIVDDDVIGIAPEPRHDGNRLRTQGATRTEHLNPSLLRHQQAR